MKNILVVVDYQNDFVNGSLGFDGAELLDEGISNLIRKFGKGNVFHTLDTHPENYLDTREGSVLPINHCIKGTDGHMVFGETFSALNEVESVEIEKTSFGVSPYWFVMSDEAPIQGDVDSITLVGLVTNICVISNAVTFQAAYPQAKIKVVSNLCASFDKGLHDKTIDVLKGLQVEVI